MKNVEIIDVLPTLFGLIAAAGALNQDMWSETSLGPLMLFGGGAVTLITSVASVIIARRGHTFSMVHALNMFWVLLSFVSLYFVVVGLSHPLQFTF